MKKLLLGLFFFASALLFGIDQLLYVGDVSRPPEKDWRLTPGDISMQQTPWPNGESGLTIKFTYQAHPDGWPSGKFYIPEGMRDWRSAKKLFIEVYCEQAGRIGVCVATYNDPKFKQFENLNFFPGRNTIELDLKEMEGWNLGNVKYIDIFSSRPDHSYSLYVGDIHMDVNAPAADRTLRMETAAALKTSFAWRKAGLEAKIPKEFQDFQRSIERLSEAPEWDELQTLQAECETIFPQLDKRFFRQAAAQGSSVSALWCLPEEKVLRGEYAFYAQPTREFTMDAALGEGESAQLVVRSGQALQGIKAELVAAPVADDGTAFPLDALTIAPLGYVKTFSPAYKVNFTGYWPDPILEYLQTPIPMEADTYQSWWLDAQVPHRQKPGLYRGQVRITYDNGGEIIMPYAIRVRSFELADGVPYFSPVSFACLELYPKDAVIRRKYWEDSAKLLIRHRMQPDRLYHGYGRPTLVEESKWLLDNGAGHFNLGNVNKVVDDELEAQIAQAYQECKAAGIIDKAYIYCYDECPASMFDTIRESLRRVRRAAPGVPIYTTTYDSTFGKASDLDEVIDCWIPLTTVYGRCVKDAAEARARGRKIGWYVCCGPREPYANFLLEYPSAGARLLMGFMNWKFKPDCFLYYSAIVWREWEKNEKGEYTFKNMIRTPLTGGPLFEYPWIGESFRNFSGDGRLYYPAVDGPIPTQRLKFIRDGGEDWMYMDLLQKELASGRHTPEWEEVARKELEVEDTLAESLTIWARNPQILRDKRTRIANLLEK